MANVLQACAKASKLEHRREQQVALIQTLAPGEAGEFGYAVAAERTEKTLACLQLLDQMSLTYVAHVLHAWQQIARKTVLLPLRVVMCVGTKIPCLYWATISLFLFHCSSAATCRVITWIVDFQYSYLDSNNFAHRKVFLPTCSSRRPAKTTGQDGRSTRESSEGDQRGYGQVWLMQDGFFLFVLFKHGTDSCHGCHFIFLLLLVDVEAPSHKQIDAI